MRDDVEFDETICAPADVRRCRFIDPAAAALAPMRLVGDKRVAEVPPGVPVVVDDRGRVEDAASLGREEPPFREALCGVPDARFLDRQDKQNKLRVRHPRSSHRREEMPLTVS